jgi:phosphoglycerate dehydrogenase-like enzyme
MPKPIHVMLYGVQPVAHAWRIEEVIQEPVHFDKWQPGDPPEALAAGLAQADAAVAMIWPASTPPAPKLKFLQLPGTGADLVALEVLPKGCIVSNVYDHEIAIAEYVMLGMLESCIRLGRLDARFRVDGGRWEDSLHFLPTPRRELHGTTVGILGYGHIGKEVARRAKAFGQRVIAATRTPRPDGLADEINPMSALDRVIAESDYLVMALPGDDTTRDLLDARRLGLMKQDAVLINIGRAVTIDERALYEVLRDKRIGGAVLDVWYQYPKPGTGPAGAPSRFPFLELDNVLASPHCSGWSEEHLVRRWRFIARQLDRVARGEAVENVIRPGV